MKIINKEGIEEMSDEKRGIYIRSGIVVVTKGEWTSDRCSCLEASADMHLSVLS